MKNNIKSPVIYNVANIPVCELAISLIQWCINFGNRMKCCKYTAKQEIAIQLMIRF